MRGQVFVGDPDPHTVAEVARELSGAFLRPPLEGAVMERHLLVEQLVLGLRGGLIQGDVADAPLDEPLPVGVLALGARMPARLARLPLLLPARDL